LSFSLRSMNESWYSTERTQAMARVERKASHATTAPPASGCTSSLSDPLSYSLIKRLRRSTSTRPSIRNSSSAESTSSALLLLVALIKLSEPRLEHRNPLPLFDLVVEGFARRRAGLLSAAAETIGTTTGFGLATGVGGGADEAVEGEEGALVELVDVELDLLVDVLL
jgi:hypothetical protein